MYEDTSSECELLFCTVVENGINVLVCVEGRGQNQCFLSVFEPCVRTV